MGKQVIIYARQSTYREESISLDVQVEHCLNACRTSGYEVVGEPVIDADLSGRSFKNRSIGPIIARIAAGEAAVVMVWKWSRWGRNTRESLNWIAELQAVGGTLEAATEPIDASTPVGKFSVTQMLAVAELLSDQIGDSWRDAKRGMVTRGLPPAGGPRFGYSYDRATKTYSPHPTVGPALTQAYERFTAGASFHALVLWLRDRGVTSTRGGALSEQGLRLAMDSGFAAGLIYLAAPEKILTPDQMAAVGAERGRPVWIPNLRQDGTLAWVPLIGPDLWQAYQDHRDGRRAIPARARNPRTPLTGLLRCAGCGRTLTYRPDRGRWGCPWAPTKGGTPCPVRVTISHTDALTAVTDWLTAHRDHADPSSEYAQAVRRDRVDTNLATLQRAWDDLDRQRAALVRSIARQIITEVEAATEMRTIRAELERTSRELSAARARAATVTVPAPDTFAGILATIRSEGDPAVTNTHLGRVLDSLWVYPFRQRPRTVPVARWDEHPQLPPVVLPDTGQGEGRVCLRCQQWKPAGEFYRRRRGNQLLAQCKDCRAVMHQEWRAGQAAGSASP